MEEIKAYLQNIRTEYNLDTLDKNSVNPDPVMQFANWMQQAIDRNISDPNAMNLATVSKEGKPTSRIVLLRNFDHDGFVFFSNYESEKGRNLNDNHFAALNFYWPELTRQIRIGGAVTLLDPSQSDDYFNTRPRESQIGAWASAQSANLKDRSELDEKVKNLTSQFEGKSIPRPPYWGGFKLHPEYYEFWLGRPNRLHDRIHYSKAADNNWTISRLYP